MVLFLKKMRFYVHKTLVKDSTEKHSLISNNASLNNILYSKINRVSTSECLTLTPKHRDHSNRDLINKDVSSIIETSTARKSTIIPLPLKCPH